MIGEWTIGKRTSELTERMGKHFRDGLEGMDRLLNENVEGLACKDIADTYLSVIGHLEEHLTCPHGILKELRGNSHGFTGLSEFLVFRLLLHQISHQLGGGFHPQQCPKSRDLWEFVSTMDSRVKIGQSTRVERYRNKRPQYPDISLWQGDKLIGVVQIKIYITNGRKEINSEVEKLKKLRKMHRDLRALFLVFHGVPEKSYLRDELERKMKTYDWFSYLILQEKENPLAEELQRGLKLERLGPTWSPG